MNEIIDVKNRKTRIFVFGNPLVREDSLPLKLLPKLKEQFPQIDFREFDTVEDLSEMGRHINIIDTVIDLNDVSVINDIDKLRTEKACSLHDFDLAINLKLMKKAGMLSSVKIFGIPPEISERKAFEKLCKLIETV